MNLWIGYNDQNQTQDRAAAIVLARDEQMARDEAYTALWQYSRNMPFAGCVGKCRRFAIIDWVEPWDGREPDGLPFVILEP